MGPENDWDAWARPRYEAPLPLTEAARRTRRKWRLIQASIFGAVAAVVLFVGLWNGSDNWLSGLGAALAAGLVAGLVAAVTFFAIALWIEVVGSYALHRLRDKRAQRRDLESRARSALSAEPLITLIEQGRDDRDHVRDLPAPSKRLERRP
jgi:hypothetical protein